MDPICDPLCRSRPDGGPSVAYGVLPRFWISPAYRQWILEHRSWPRVDPFTYTLLGRPYIDMHGLFQIALALAYRGGMIGIGLLRVAFALATFAILWLSAGQRGVRSPALLGLGLLIALDRKSTRLNSSHPSISYA